MEEADKKAAVIMAWSTIAKQRDQLERYVALSKTSVKVMDISSQMTADLEAALIRWRAISKQSESGVSVCITDLETILEAAMTADEAVLEPRKPAAPAPVRAPTSGGWRRPL